MVPALRYAFFDIELMITPGSAFIVYSMMAAYFHADATALM